MDRLPEELQLRILEYLDSGPPSESRARQEPTLGLPRSEHHSLKEVASVSKHWRRLTLPQLFRHAHFQIDIPVQKHWKECCLHDDSTLRVDAPRDTPPGVDAYHSEMIQTLSRTTGDTQRLSAQSRTRSKTTDDVHEYDTKVWAWRIYHAMKDFVGF